MLRLLTASALLASALAASPALTIDTDVVVGRAKKEFIGCHIDPGFVQSPWGWSRTMIFGQSFETINGFSVPTWTSAVDASVTGTAKLDNSSNAVQVNANCPAPSMHISYISGSGVAGVANRYIGGEGLYLQQGLEYDGFALVQCVQGCALYVAVRPRGGGAAFANQTIRVAAGTPNFQRVNFSLIPSVGTECDAIVPGSDSTVDCGDFGPNPGHICVRCGGEFVIGLAEPGDLHIGFVDFGPGTWGSVGAASKAMIDVVQSLGNFAFRQGGTVAQTIAWKQWRGPQWSRAAMQAQWISGVSLAPFGPFEFIDMANAVGALPALTLSMNLEDAEDFGDLVEYCFGDESTPWGRVRIVNDSHPLPYNISIFELGNEQENPSFVEQVTAMEQRRVKIGAPSLTFLYPDNSGIDNSTAAALAAAGVPAYSVGPDCHTGSGPDCETDAFGHLPSFPQVGATLEVNGRAADLGRAMAEALDLQRYLSLPTEVSSRIRARTASFCSERSGHFIHPPWDQGLTFWLPNMTWIQPPGYVHQMISKTWADQILSTNLAATNLSALAASAQLSDDNSTLVVQLVNLDDSTQSTAFTVALSGSWSPSTTAAGVQWTLTQPDLPPGVAPNASAANTPAQPTYVSPTQKPITWPSGGSSTPLLISLPPLSFTILTFPAA
jgi:hypothetical protein